MHRLVEKILEKSKQIKNSKRTLTGEPKDEIIILGTQPEKTAVVKNNSPDQPFNQYAQKA